MTRRLVNVAAVAVAQRSSFFCLGYNVGPSSLFFSLSTTSRNSHRPCRTLNNNIILLRQCATTSSNAELEETRNRRCGVVFRLGQVVQHRDERWRGIVVEWDNLNKPVDTERPNGAVQTVSNDFSKSTTPTNKNYTWTVAEDSYEATRVRYTVLLDEGDADALESQLKRTVCSRNWIS